MSNNLTNIYLRHLIDFLHKSRNTVKIPTDFHSQVAAIRGLLSNDCTGYVSTINDYMVKSATVPLKIETEDNGTLERILDIWQKEQINRNASIDIPSGMRSLSQQYFMERWSSSFIVLNISWKDVDLGSAGFYKLPDKMWFTNGAAVSVEGSDSLTQRVYKVGDKQLKNTENKSVLIRKPFNSWYDKYPTPYFVKRGTLYNALLKKQIKAKQAETLDEIIFYMLNISAGSDALAKMKQVPTEDDLKALKKQFVKAEEETYERTGKRVGAFPYDVKLDHFMPELKKIFNSDIVAPVDKDLLASLGMIELRGFSSNREEAILNPKIMVEEVLEGVADWADLLEDVVLLILEKNKEDHPRLTSQRINVVPGIVKSFVTDDLRSMVRSLYDRGLVSKQSALEYMDMFNFEIEVERRKKEDERDLQRICKPPVIQNLEQYTDPELEDQDKQPGTPEADNFNQAVLDGFYKNRNKIIKGNEYVEAPYDKNSELPKEIRDALPPEAQTIFRKAFNSALEQGLSEEEAFKVAWATVKKVYKKDENDKWVKIKDSAINTIDDLPEEIKGVFNLADRVKFVKNLNKR